MTLTLSVRADEDGGLEDDEAARDRPGERGKGRRTPPLEVAEALAVALRYLPPAVLESARAGMEAIRPLPLSEVDLPLSRVMCDVVMYHVVMANIVSQVGRAYSQTRIIIYLLLAREYAYLVSILQY
jgi:hypothetical protein